MNLSLKKNENLDFKPILGLYPLFIVVLHSLFKRVVWRDSTFCFLWFLSYRCFTRSPLSSTSLSNIRPSVPFQVFGGDERAHSSLEEATSNNNGEFFSQQDPHFTERLYRRHPVHSFSLQGKLDRSYIKRKTSEKNDYFHLNPSRWILPLLYLPFREQTFPHSWRMWCVCLYVVFLLVGWFVIVRHLGSHWSVHSIDRPKSEE